MQHIISEQASFIKPNMAVARFEFRLTCIYVIVLNVANLSNNTFLSKTLIKKTIKRESNKNKSHRVDTLQSFVLENFDNMSLITGRQCFQELPVQRIVSFFQ